MTRTIRKARVLHALMLREMVTRYGVSRLGYVWALLEPIGFIALLTLLFSQLAHAPPVGKSFPLFYATGYIAFHWFQDISSVVARSAFVNRPLFTFPAVTPLDTVIARFVLQALTGLAVAALIFVGILSLLPDQIGIDPLRLLTGFGLACALALSVGLLNVWATAISKAWEIAWQIVSRPLLLISCVFFTFWQVPVLIREVLWYNPLIHIVGSLRAGFYPAYDGSHISSAYVLAISAALAVIGLLGLRYAPTRIMYA